MIEHKIQVFTTAMHVNLSVVYKKSKPIVLNLKKKSSSSRELIPVR